MIHRKKKQTSELIKKYILYKHYMKLQQMVLENKKKIIRTLEILKFKLKNITFIHT